MNRLLVPLTLVALILAGCSRQSAEKKVEAAKPPEPVSILTAAAEARTVERSLAVTGSLHPDETVTVSSEVPGRVVSIRADFGQYVRKGDVIVELDKQELSLQVDRAKASLAQALARVGLNASQEEVTPESTPSMRQAQAQLDDAQSKFERAERLLKTGDIARERFTELEKAYIARKAAFEATRDDLRTQLATIAALRADVRLAQKRLSDATVRAPFDGTVSQKHVSPGQYTKENTAFVTLVKTNPLRLRVEIPEPATGAVKVGTELTFLTGAAPGAEFHAVVRELNPSLDPKARSLTAEARLRESDSRLRPGMFVQVSLVTQKAEQVVAVPRNALYTIAGLTKLFTVEQGPNGETVKEHRIVPGVDLGALVEIPGGVLRVGDRVAVSRLPQLSNNLPVQSRKTAAPKG
ncbi:MAG: efflux RND transporter periplasmic adaptor subunit [Bryobacteraceae bacterium]|nr:efflux RND transporter periplasmic adaptor subunit [Bryobacteraceae bacterium]